MTLPYDPVELAVTSRCEMSRRASTAARPSPSFYAKLRGAEMPLAISKTGVRKVRLGSLLATS